MKHAIATDRERERAALYALGTLDAEEAARFAEHLAEGCGPCRAEVETRDRFAFLLAGEGVWTEVEPRILRRDLGDGAYLVRMEPGARAETHRHDADEHCYVLEGDLRVAGRHIRAGDYHRAAAGSVHEVPHSDGGCLLLIVESRA